MKHYEYREERNMHSTHIVSFCNQLGQEGWELCNVRGGNNYLFKRELLTPPTTPS